MLAIIEPAVVVDMELSRLQQCERAIDSALARMSDAWREIGDNLRTIRDERLHERAGVTFDDYIAGKWPNLSRSTVYEWMEAGAVVKNVERASVLSGEVIEPPARISHARELSRLPPIAQPIALTKAREIASEQGRAEPTVYDFKRAVAVVLEEPEPPAPDEIKRQREQNTIMSTITRLYMSLEPCNRRALLERLANETQDES